MKTASGMRSTIWIVSESGSRRRTEASLIQGFSSTRWASARRFTSRMLVSGASPRPAMMSWLATWRLPSTWTSATRK
jgi:hypothetical protein